MTTGSASGLALCFEALAQARATNASDVVREGKLLDPDAGVGGVPIPDGSYRCRTVKVGAKSQGMLNYVAYPFSRCRVNERRAAFHQT